jgi:hypothetical protein
MKNLITMIMVMVLLFGFTSQSTAAVDPISLATWIIGFISTRPQTFYTSIGSVDLIVDMPSAFKTKYGLIESDTLYLKPYSQQESEKKTTANSQGACFRTISRQDGGKTSINVFFPDDKNGQITDGIYRVYHVPDSADGTGASSEIINEGHFNSNNFSMNYQLDDSKNPYRIVAYPLAPKNMKDTAVNLTVYARTLSFYAREINFEKNGQLGKMMYDAESMRAFEANKDKRTASLNIKIRGKNTPTNLVIIDQYGEVMRGFAPSNDFSLQVAPGNVGILRGQGEGELASIPAMPNGLVNVSQGADNAVMLVPPDYKQFCSSNASHKYEGRIKVFAPQGSNARIEVFDGATKLVDTSFTVSAFSGAEINLRQGRPIGEVAVTVNGNRISRKIICPDQPLVYNFENPIYYSYSLHNADPVVPGGLSYMDDKRYPNHSVIPFVKSGIFDQKCRELNIPENVIRRIHDKFVNGQFGYTMAGPDVREFNDNGRRFNSVNRIKGMTSGSAKAKKEHYFLRFKEYCRVWIPDGEVGWVPMIDSICGNVDMCWIEPVYPTPVRITYVPIPIAPPSIDVPMIGLSWLYIGGDNARNSSSVNNPTAPPPYIPAADFNLNIDNGNNIANSQSQGQGQHQGQNQNQNQGQNQGQTSTNNNYNNNQNTVNPSFNINNANNNINQLQQGTNVLIPISVVNGQ